jgi:acyl-homoserine-lactone acylase
MDDVYKLDINPVNPLQYWFDDHWETLEVRRKTVKVKVGALLIPITKTFYWSKYGTTLKNKNGCYAIRFPANMDIRSIEQLYLMSKASNFSEWRNAMRMGSIPGMNFVYADRNDTTFYVSTGQFPYRNTRYNWKMVLPGNTAATLWKPVFHPFDEMPQVLNPKSGYLVNTNNTCFDVTDKADNVKPENYDPTFGFGTDENNRSIMAHYLIGQYKKLSYEDFKHVKYNRSFNDSMYEYALNNISVLMNLNPVKYPDLADAIAVVKSWNHGSEPDNQEAALVNFALFQIIDKLVSRGINYESNSCPESEYVSALAAAKKHMLKYFGSLRIPLGETQKHVRGNVELPVGGVPEVLAANISSPYKNGMRKTNVGESYIELVRYSKDTVEIETVSPFGASNEATSKHYTDQMQMYVEQKLKPMTLDKTSIYKNAESIYHPGKNPDKMRAKGKEALSAL